VPSIVVDHAHALTLRSFLRQHFNYGRGALLFHRERAQRQQRRATMESPRFYVSLLLWPWSAYGPAKAPRMCLLFLVAQTAHTGGYLRAFLEGTQKGPKLV
jgi:hypothetical protein